MLIIRDQQMEALRQAAEQRFEEKASELLRKGWPEETKDMGYDELLSWVQRGIKRARRYGLAEDSPVCRFLNIRFAIGESFPNSKDYPWAESILTDTDLAQTEKMDRLLEEFAERY